MTKEKLITVSEGISLEDSKKLLHEHRIEKLLVVDSEGMLIGMITIKDIEKIKKYPHACKDNMGRLRVGAAVGVGPDREARLEALLRAGTDVIVIDTAHGHSRRVLETVADRLDTVRRFILIRDGERTPASSRAAKRSE